MADQSELACVYAALVLLDDDVAITVRKIILKIQFSYLVKTAVYVS